MRRILGFYIFLIPFVFVDLLYDELGFTTLLKEDIKRIKLYTHHFIGDASKLKEFNQFTNINLKQYKRVSSVEGIHNIDKWSSKNTNIQTIIRIKTTVHVDSIYKSSYTSFADSTEYTTNHHIKGDVIFTSFKFIKKSGQIYTYFSVNSEGVTKYSIGNKEYYIGYEDIGLAYEFVQFEIGEEIKSILEKIKD